jgi:16S rRNA (guanine966-N2)-methyltransferase
VRGASRSLRVVAGSLRSRPLVSPPRGVRPTSDRVRESLFSRLGDISEAHVLDLFCGTGSLGIEAISRGASRAVFVDRSGASIRAVSLNIDNLGIESQCEILRGEVRATVRRLAKQGERFDLIFADPPYDGPDLANVLAETHLADLLAHDGTLVVESATRHSFPTLVHAGLDVLDERSQGETRITRLVRSDEREIEQDEAGQGERPGGEERSRG